MIYWSQRHFFQEIYLPVYQFACTHCSPTELSELLIWLNLAWQKPHEAQEMFLLFERELALRLPGYNRSLAIEEEAFFDKQGTIRRDFCTYESHRMGKMGKSSRFAWNSPDRNAGPLDPKNHHTRWHKHEKDTVSFLPPESETNLKLFSEYLEWLKESVASEEN
jgi:hypothetical protein